MIGSGPGVSPRGCLPIVGKATIPAPRATVRVTPEAEPVVNIGAALDIATNPTLLGISCTRAGASFPRSRQ
jgi:hypothetical protein